MSSEKSQGKSVKLLVGVLAVTALAYIALTPKLREVQEETKRIEAAIAEKQKQESELQSKKSEVEKARTAARNESTNPARHLELAQKLSDSGDTKGATEAALTAARLAPDNASTHLILASLYDRSRDYDLSLEAFQKCLSLSPNDPRALVGLAYLYTRLGWPQESINLLREVANGSQSTPQIKVALALAYVQRADFTKAEQLLGHVKSENPRDWALWSPIISCYLDGKQPQKALEAAKEAMTLAPENPTFTTLQGQAYYALNDFARAQETLESAVSRNSNDYAARYYLALTHQKLKALDSAVSQLETIYRAAPDFKATRRILAGLYLQQQQKGWKVEAKRLMDEDKKSTSDGQAVYRASYLVANEPANAKAHFELGRLYAQTNDLARAIVEIKQTLKLKPDHPEAQPLLNSLLAKAGRP